MSARGSSSPHRCFPLICGVVLAQRGPAFPRKIDMTIDARSGLVVVQSTDEHGRDEHFDEHMDLPDNLANGLVPILLKNATSAAPLKSLSLLVATPKPRLVKLAISSHVWILEGRAPAFIRSEQPFFEGGPLWRIDLAVPTTRGGQRGS